MSSVEKRDLRRDSFIADIDNEKIKGDYANEATTRAS
jgi:hypothetical protein